MLTEAGVCGVPVLALVAHLPCKKNGNISRSSAFVCFKSGREGASGFFPLATITQFN